VNRVACSWVIRRFHLESTPSAVQIAVANRPYRNLTRTGRSARITYGLISTPRKVTSGYPDSETNLLDGRQPASNLKIFGCAVSCRLNIRIANAPERFTRQFTVAAPQRRNAGCLLSRSGRTLISFIKVRHRYGRGDWPKLTVRFAKFDSSQIAGVNRPSGKRFSTELCWATWSEEMKLMTRRRGRLTARDQDRVLLDSGCHWASV
jgi:hypothetical protein